MATFAVPVFGISGLSGLLDFGDLADSIGDLGSNSGTRRANNGANTQDVFNTLIGYGESFGNILGSSGIGDMFSGFSPGTESNSSGNQDNTDPFANLLNGFNGNSNSDNSGNSTGLSDMFSGNIGNAGDASPVVDIPSLLSSLTNTATAGDNPINSPDSSTGLLDGVSSSLGNAAASLIESSGSFQGILGNMFNLDFNQLAGKNSNETPQTTASSFNYDDFLNNIASYGSSSGNSSSGSEQTTETATKALYVPSLTASSYDEEAESETEEETTQAPLFTYDTYKPVEYTIADYGYDTGPVPPPEPLKNENAATKIVSILLIFGAFGGVAYFSVKKIF